MSEQIAEPEVEPQAPPPDPPAQEPVAEPEVVAAPDGDDDALEPDLAAQVIDIPDGEKLVPLSALKAARREAKAAKAAVANTPNLQQQVSDLQATIQQQAPLAEAARAILAAQQQQPQVPQQPAAPVEDTAELESVAKLFDFYKGDGTLDLDKARKYQAHVESVADRKAQAQTAPLVQDTLTARASHNVARAKATKLPGTDEGADPVILDALVSRISQQPNGVQTLADPEAMKQLWLVAYGQTQAMKALKPKAAAPAAPANPPLFSEKSGGQAPAPKALDASEKRLAKDMGMTEAEYLKSASKMPW